MSHAQDHENLTCVCPLPQCWLEAEVTRTWTMPTYSDAGRTEELHAATRCPAGHTFTVEWSSLTLLNGATEQELARLIYEVPDTGDDYEIHFEEDKP